MNSVQIPNPWFYEEADVAKWHHREDRGTSACGNII